jgi:hypothetical protein
MMNSDQNNRARWKVHGNYYAKPTDAKIHLVGEEEGIRIRRSSRDAIQPFYQLAPRPRAIFPHQNHA